MPKLVMMTPEMAADYLSRNDTNRPISEAHVKRIGRAIKAGQWKMNGDTIKISKAGKLLDGQHRLHGILESRISVPIIVVEGVEEDVFPTIDTLRKMRSASDILSIHGVYSYRSIIAGALPWLIRWQRGVIADYQKPENKVENYDIEEAMQAHGGIVMAADRASKLRGIAAPSLIAFFYYVLANRNGPLAERMMRSLEYPTSLPMNDPFFVLRTRLMNRGKHESSLHAIAWMIKAANAAHRNAPIERLVWSVGNNEAFPTLKVEGLL